MCPQCLEIWEKARNRRCPVCQKTARGCTCRPLHLLDTDPIGERKVSSLAFYEKFGSEDVRDKLVLALIYSVKTASDKSAVRLCARELSHEILRTLTINKENFNDYKITYPPRTIKRILKYGFDHSRYLAKYISQYTGIPLAPILLNVGKRPQKSLNALARNTNAKSSYSVRKDAIVSGKYIVVDDIITTGATVNAVADLLKVRGAESVYPVSIARAKKKKRKALRPSSRPWFSIRPK